MFTHISNTAESNIKIYRDTLSPNSIWLRLSNSVLICVDFNEAQQIAAGITRELQAAIASAQQEAQS